MHTTQTKHTVSFVIILLLNAAVQGEQSLGTRSARLMAAAARVLNPRPSDLECSLRLEEDTPLSYYSLSLIHQQYFKIRLVHEATTASGQGTV